MLVLSRKVGEQLVIGENIRLTIVEMPGNRVSIGIEAPPHIHILRAELPPSDLNSTAGAPQAPAQRRETRAA